MLSLRDVIDFASMSDDLAQELTRQKIGLPDLGAVVAGLSGITNDTVSGCSASPCAAACITNDMDIE